MRLKGRYILQLFDPHGGGISIDNVSLDEIKEFVLAKDEKPQEVKKVVKEEPKKKEVKKDEK